VGRQRAHEARRAHVPQKDGLIVGSAHENVALGREGERVDVVMVANKRDRVRFALKEKRKQPPTSPLPHQSQLSFHLLLFFHLL
jgi:hypothetical protein